MTTPPADKECEVILQWMHAYYDGPLEPWEREFIRDNYWKDEFDNERWQIDAIVRARLAPLPESLEKFLEVAK